jgi:hypothetical protein
MIISIISIISSKFWQKLGKFSYGKCRNYLTTYDLSFFFIVAKIYNVVSHKIMELPNDYFMAFSSIKALT